MNEAARPRRDALLWGVFAAYVVLGAVGLLHHEMWRDELRVWLMVTCTPSLDGFLQAFAGEAHPFLWYVLVYLASVLGRSPGAMQVLHLAIAAGTAWLVLFRAPFPRWTRIALLGGYYFLFEYLVISRSYALTMLLTFTVCALWTQRWRWWWAYLLLLILLAQANLYGAIAMGAFVVAELTAGRKLWRVVGVLGAATAGTIFLATTLFLPRPENAAGAPRFFLAADGTKLFGALAAVLRALFPIPGQARHFWYSMGIPATWPVALVAVAILAVLVLYLHRRPVALAFFVAATAALLAFGYVVFLDAWRHVGAFYVYLLAAAWLAGRDEQRWEPSPALARAADGLRRYATPAIAIVLAVQVAVGVFAYSQDFARPFSGAKATAAYLRASRPHAQVIVDGDKAGEALAAYLGRPVIFYRRRALSMYVPYLAPRDSIAPGDMLYMAWRFAEEGEPTVLVFTYPVAAELRAACPPGYTAEQVYRGSPDTIENSEIFDVYVVKRQ